MTEAHGPVPGTFTGEVALAAGRFAGVSTTWKIVGGAFAALVIFAIVAGAIGAATEDNTVSAQFGGLKIEVTNARLSGSTLTVPLTIANDSDDGRYDYDVVTSFVVNLAQTGTVVGKVSEGFNPGTLAPKESRDITVVYDLPAGACPNVLQFEAIKGFSRGDMPLSGLGCAPK